MTISTGFTNPANAQASADHLARKLKGYPPGFGQWPKDDQHAHHAAGAALHEKKVVTKPPKVKPANENKQPVSDMGNDGPGAPLAEYFGPGSWDDVEVVTPTEALRSPGEKFKLERWQDITFDGNDEWLIKKILPRCGVAALYGASETYKSFVALNIALCVALGVPWAGRQVCAGTVVYVASEAPKGLRKRTTGYKTARRDLPADIPFHLVEVAPDLGTDASDRDKLVADIAAALGDVKPALIVIDTLIKSIGNADENGAGMIAFAGNCGAISQHFGCLVLAVHHVGLGADSQQRMRGHSSLRGGLDTQILCERPETRDLVTRLTVQKQKEDAKNFCLEARLERVILAYDDDGDEVSTLIVSEVVNTDATAIEAKTPTVTRAQRLMTDIILQAINEARETIKPFADGPDVRATDNDRVRELYYEAIAEPADAEEDPAKVAARKRQAFNRAIKAQLNAKTLVARQIDGRRMLWLP